MAEAVFAKPKTTSPDKMSCEKVTLIKHLPILTRHFTRAGHNWPTIEPLSSANYVLSAEKADGPARFREHCVINMRPFPRWLPAGSENEQLAGNLPADRHRASWQLANWKPMNYWQVNFSQYPNI